jgi:hypothetical protein
MEEIISDTNWYKIGQNEFKISTAEQLAGLAKLVNSEIDFKDKTIKLESNITFNDITNWKSWTINPPVNIWIPIGTETKPFNLTFDGNNHTIEGIYVNSDCGCHQGLFGYIGHYGKIKNLSIKYSFVKGNTMVGGLAGASKGEINNSCYEGIVTGMSRIGGLVGVSECTITNSYSNSTVTGEHSANNIGGLVGENWGIINNSYSTGTVTGMHRVGGLVGGNCHTKDDVAGLVGQNSPKCQIIKSYYDMETSKQNDLYKGDGKTTAKMKQRDTFEDWNFENIWDIKSTINNGYPYLRENKP